MEINWRNVNYGNINYGNVKYGNVNNVATEKSLVSEDNRKLRKVNYFIRAWNRNAAIKKAIDEFKWDYPYEDVRIVDIRVQMWSYGHGYAPNYYKVTITYTYEGEDNDWDGGGGVPYLPW